jgi:hypothetical protein
LRIEFLHVHLPDRADQPRPKNGTDVDPQQCLVAVEGSRFQSRLGHGCEPLVEILVEGDGCRARRSRPVSLLKLEVQKALRLAQWIVKGLVQVLARPGLGVAPLVNANELRALSARNNLPWLAGHDSPSARSWAHNRHTWYRGDQALSGFEKGVIDEACQWPHDFRTEPDHWRQADRTYE